MIKGNSPNGIGRVYITSAGRLLRTLFRRAPKEVQGKPWFVVGMHGGSTIGEQYFCCELDKLPKVLKGIAEDSPEFRAMLVRCAGLQVTVDAEIAGDRGQSPEPILDRSRAIVI